MPPPVLDLRLICNLFSIAGTVRPRTVPRSGPEAEVEVEPDRDRAGGRSREPGALVPLRQACQRVTQRGFAETPPLVFRPHRHPVDAAVILAAEVARVPGAIVPTASPLAFATK